MVENIKEYLIPANKAREETNKTNRFYDRDNNLNLKVQETLSEIKEQICKAIDEGMYGTDIALIDKFSSVIMPILKDLGYNVFCFPIGRSYNIIRIEW